MLSTSAYVVLGLFFQPTERGGPAVQGEVRRPADRQHQAHGAQLAEYERLLASGRLVAGSPQRATLELGLRFERLAIDFWDELAHSPAGEVPGEPDGGGCGMSRAEPGRPAFVLHEHRRPQHHFDLRLEEAGVLRSWALPKGLPAEPGENRLAVAVPDHELDHLTYTDADKSVADTGWWEEHDRTERRILLTLHGRHGARRYALIQTARDWLLRLTKDQPTAE